MLHKQISKSLSEIMAVEGKFSDLVKKGSKDPMHQCNMIYYEGILNAFKLFNHLLQTQLDDDKYRELFDQMMRYDIPKEKVN